MKEQGRVLLIDRMLANPDGVVYPVVKDGQTEVGSVPITNDFYGLGKYGEMGFGDFLGKSQVFYIQNVYEFYKEESRKKEVSGEKFWVKDFFSLIPPFEICWLEWRSYIQEYRASAGVLLGRGLYLNEKLKKRCVVQATIIQEANFAFGGKIACIGNAKLTLDEWGNPVDDGLVVSVPDAADSMGMKEVWRTGATAMLLPAVFAIQFMNCKNVEWKTITPPSGLEKSFKRKHGTGLVRYHTLCIDPMRKILKVEGKMETSGMKKALHVCRGHFATLTRNNKGEILPAPTTYFRHDHVRGNKDNGIVVKDYSVKAPKV